jgi:transcription antitermination factor NusG
MDDLRWYAAYIEPNKEQRVHDALVNDDIECFYPFFTEWVRTHQRHRSRLARRPYFPRYLFVRCRDGAVVEECHGAGLRSLATVRGVSYVVGPDHIPSPIPDSIMDRLIRTACPNGEILMGRARKTRFKAGDQLKITEESSPLVGMLLTYLSGHGKIHAELKNGNKIVVPLDQVERVGE